MKKLDFSKILSVEEANSRYFAAAHAMQSGVAMKLNFDQHETTAKHLRVGINSALVDGSALAELLIHKGLITDEEYLTAIALGMEREKEEYREQIQEHYPNVRIDLG